ncbi:glutathione peroxidase [Humisphaera borealis]|uniref:Glutathione peroxidase n=1 Tax=Humisphaera borealis TaxID=2807512 RepID=A0A7M2X3C0_9BACT|nr:glutathione peroxidase [Humisphaera borealis]QOV92174.1 glutathione peroxidase [Humisphaera borealis]
MSIFTSKLRTCLVALSSLVLGGSAIAADAKPAAKKPAAGDVITAPTQAPAKDSPLSHTLKDIEGKDADLSKLKGKVVMFVNVASKCGNTPQYKQLEEVYEKYKGKGLVIVGIPANEFGKQEPGTNEQIKEFCSSKYAVTFPMMGKIVVKGEGIHPLYKQLTSTPGMEGDVSWNFQKYIVDRNGATIARIAPKTKPDDAKVIDVLEKALAAEPAK